MQFSKHIYPDKKELGFTLVELAIVLVIIGLLVSGIIAGQSLIASARIQSQVNQLNEYQTAYNLFINKYDAIPGDMNTADEYWSGATIGNGDGELTDSAYNAYLTTKESIVLFEHLSRAGFIKETYTNTWAIGEGYPELEIVPGTGMIASRNIGSTPANYQLSADEHTKASLFLMVSLPHINAWHYQYPYAVTTPEVMKRLDEKMDDGIARNGRFKSFSVRYHASWPNNCLTGIDGDYNVTQTERVCHAQFILQK